MYAVFRASPDPQVRFLQSFHSRLKIHQVHLAAKLQSAVQNSGQRSAQQRRATTRTYELPVVLRQSPNPADLVRIHGIELNTM